MVSSIGRYSAAQFNLSVSVMCKNLGATLLERGFVLIRVEPTYQFETAYGKLTVRAIDDWIACRFLEPSRAMNVLSWQSKNSGKWNFGSSRCDRRETFLSFARKLQEVVGVRVQPDQVQLPLVGVGTDEVVYA